MELFTADHADHAPQWCSSLPGQQQQVCLACVVQLLEDDDLLLVKKQHVLGGLLQLLQHSGDDILGRLGGADTRVTLHLTLILLGLTTSDSQPVITSANEAAYRVLIGSQSEELVYCTLEHIAHQSVGMCNYKKCLPCMSLLGRLLHAMPHLATLLLQDFGSYIDFVCCGLLYPDTDVRTAVTYICVHLYANSSACQYMPSQLHATVAKGLLDVLKTAGEQELLLNALGLLKVLLEDEQLTRLVMTLPSEQLNSSVSMAAVLKKLLLSNKELVQVATVQCMLELLQRGGGLYAEGLLQADMAEFLFEVLDTTNEMLISGVHSCLRLIAECQIFFTKCHAVYGIEAMLRSLEQLQKQKNYEQSEQGLELLCVVLERHSGSVRIFSNVKLVQQCCTILGLAIDANRPPLQNMAAKTYIQMLRKSNLPLPIPYDDLLCLIINLSDKVGDQPVMESAPSEKTKGKNTSYHTQSLVAVLVEALYKTMLLVKSCAVDPLCNNDVYKAPSTTEAPSDGQKDDYIQKLVTVAFDCALPAVMANHQYLDVSQVYQNVFDCLSLVYDLCPPIHNVLSEKLLHVHFVPFVLSAKAKFHGEDAVNVSSSTDNVLRIILSTLAQLDKNEDFLNVGLSPIKGSAHDVCCLLSQYAPPDSGFQHTQQAIILLLYLTMHSDNSFVPPPLLDESLSCYLSMHQLDSIPDRNIGWLLYLWTTCHDKCAPSPLDSKLSIRLSAIDDISGHECLLSAPVVNWILKDELRAASSTGSVMIDALIDGSEGSQTFLQSVASESIPCIHALLKVIVCGSRQQAQSGTQVLQKLVQNMNQDHVSSDVAEFLLSALPDLLHSTFTDHHELPQDDNLSALIDLNTAIIQQLTSLPEVNLQLLYHLCRLISRSKHSIEVHTSVICYLNSLLLLQEDQHEVSSVLLCNAELLHWLERVIGSPDHPGCPHAHVTTALLLQQQIKHKLKVDHFILISSDEILRCLFPPSHPMLLPTLLILSQYFHGNEGTLVQLTGSTEEKKGTTSPKVLRLLYMNLQQCLVQENPLIQELCALCVERIISYAEKQGKIGVYLCMSPWNGVLLHSLHAQQHGRLTPWLAMLTLKFLHGNTGNVDPVFRESLVQSFLGAAKLQHDTQVACLFPIVKHMSDHKLLGAVDSRVEKCLDTASRTCSPPSDANHEDCVGHIAKLITTRRSRADD